LGVFIADALAALSSHQIARGSNATEALAHGADFDARAVEPIITEGTATFIHIAIAVVINRVADLGRGSHTTQTFPVAPILTELLTVFAGTGLDAAWAYITGFTLRWIIEVEVFRGCFGINTRARCR